MPDTLDSSPRHLASKLSLDLGQLSVAGIKPMNEDAIGIRLPEGSALTTKGAIAIIADGVSAAEAGKEASDTAVTSFISDYYSTHDTWSVKTSGLKVLIALNRWLYGRGQKYLKAEKGYVTTFSALILKSSSAYIFHVGDTRIYRVRHGRMEQLTRDHATPVGNGQHYLARALGIDPRLEVDYQEFDLLEGDKFLLSTDGVHDHLPQQRIHDILTESKDLEQTCKTLIDEALEAGSKDNLSAQIILVKATGSIEVGDVLKAINNLPFTPALKPGQSIDGWEVVRELHATSRSEVYLVKHREDGSLAALKAPSANFEDDVAYIERFAMEEWIGTRINSPNVVSVIRANQRTFFYYLTEYIEGPTLAQLLKERTRLSVPDTRNIIIQVASGLRAFHRKDTLHQDIKPDNIIYTENGIKIVDFGSTRVAGVSEIESNIEREGLLGTVDYCAPEYRLGGKISARSDQFSLGVLAYELLTGEHPFGNGYRKANTSIDFQKIKYTPAQSINPLVPIWFDGAIQKALNLNPDSRYPSLSEFVHDLKNPNPKYSGSVNSPLLDRNPVLFWQCLAGLSLIVNLLLLFLLSR